jgi:dihydrofolate reductase
MSRVRVDCFAISVDGYGAGPRQSLANPLGVGGEALHEWMYPTETFQQMLGKSAGTTGTDNDFAAAGMSNVGAWILGRNMFSPLRGPWADDSWKGWWGDSPPYRVPTFVLTHHARAPLEMAGGTTFHFVTDGAEAALERAREAAGERDVRIGGGAHVIREYLSMRAIDRLHLDVSPVLLGGGEPLFAGLDLAELGYRVIENVPTQAVMHVVIERA